MTIPRRYRLQGRCWSTGARSSTRPSTPVTSWRWWDDCVTPALGLWPVTTATVSHRARDGAPCPGADRRSDHRGRPWPGWTRSPHGVSGHHRRLCRAGRLSVTRGYTRAVQSRFGGPRGLYPPRAARPLPRAGGGAGGDLAAGPGRGSRPAGRPAFRCREPLGVGLLSCLGRGWSGRPEAGGWLASGGRALSGSPGGHLPRVERRVVIARPVTSGKDEGNRARAAPALMAGDDPRSARRLYQFGYGDHHPVCRHSPPVGTRSDLRGQGAGHQRAGSGPGRRPGHRPLPLRDRSTGSPSRCYGICAVQWPPLVVPGGVSRPVAGPGTEPGLLGHRAPDRRHHPDHLQRLAAVPVASRPDAGYGHRPGADQCRGSLVCRGSGRRRRA